MNRAPTLPPLDWTPTRLPPITPLPDVTESNSAEAWALFDSAVMACERETARLARDQQQKATA